MADDFVLDLSATRLPQLARFAASMEGLTFAQLVALAGRLDRSRERARAAHDGTAGVEGLGESFLTSLADLETHVGAMFQMVEAELDRRFTGCAAKREA